MDSGNEWVRVLCENELDKSIEEHKWKIKLLKTDNKRIFVGVAPIDFDINSSNLILEEGIYFVKIQIYIQDHLINIIVNIQV